MASILKGDSRATDAVGPTAQFIPRFPDPPKGIGFVVREGYQMVRPGDENVSRYVPLQHDKVRGDLQRMARVHVDRAAVRKVGPIYSGVLDSGGEPFVFSMSDKGVFTRAVDRNKRQEAWKVFQDLLDREYETSVKLMRKKSVR